MISFISYIPLLLVLYDIYRHWDSEKFFHYFNLLLGTIAITITAKMMFHVYRVSHIDPYAFPSGHTLIASVLLMFYKDVKLVVFPLLVGLLRVILGRHTIEQIILSFLFIPIIYWFVSFLESKGKEGNRKIFHIASAMAIAFMFDVFNSIALYVLFALLIIGLILYKHRNNPIVKRFLDYYDRDGKGIGAFTLVLGSIIYYFIEPKLMVYQAWVDGLASLSKNICFVLLYGYIGSIIGFLVTKMPIGFLFPIAEALTPYDNILLPILMGVIFFIYH